MKVCLDFPKSAMAKFIIFSETEIGKFALKTPVKIKRHFFHKSRVGGTFKHSAALSMATHCALLPAPGDSFISMEEVLVEMRKYFKDFWKTD